MENQIIIILKVALAVSMILFLISSIITIRAKVIYENLRDTITDSALKHYTHGHDSGRVTQRELTKHEIRKVLRGDAGGDDVWEFYRDTGGKNRWTRTSLNNKVVGCSSQGYVRADECMANAKRHGYKLVEVCYER